MSLKGGYHIFDMANAKWTTGETANLYTTTMPGIYDELEAIRGYGKMTIVSGFSPTGTPFSDAIALMSTADGNINFTVNGAPTLTISVSPDDKVQVSTSGNIPNPPTQENL